MTRVAGLLSFLPQEVIPVLAVCGGLLMIVGLRRLAVSLFGFCGLMIILPPIFEAVLNELPDWALYPVLALCLLSTFTFVIVLIIGPKAWEIFKANIATNVLTWIFLFPFRLVGWILGGLFSRRR